MNGTTFAFERLAARALHESRLGRALRTALAVAAQITALAAMNWVGYALAGALRLPLPGNLVGMLLLFALLSSGVVRVEWLAPGASLLTKHLAFFFIPITVGLLEFSELFLRSGAAILAVLALSMAAGICAAGFTSQALSRRIAARKGSTT